MRTDAGWRKQDGMEDDMWNSMARRPSTHVRQTPDTCAQCSYGLEITRCKEDDQWDAREVSFYACYLGARTGLMGSSTREMCDEGQMQLYFPESASAKAARTGGLTSA